MQAQAEIARLNEILKKPATSCLQRRAHGNAKRTLITKMDDLRKATRAAARAAHEAKEQYEYDHLDSDLT